MNQTSTPSPDSSVLEMLVCPVCKNELLRNTRENSLSCPVCSLKYQIRNGIPDMIPEDAEEI